MSLNNASTTHVQLHKRKRRESLASDAYGLAANSVTHRSPSPNTADPSDLDHAYSPSADDSDDDILDGSDDDGEVTSDESDDMELDEEGQPSRSNRARVEAYVHKHGISHIRGQVHETELGRPLSDYFELPCKESLWSLTSSRRAQPGGSVKSEINSFIFTKRGSKAKLSFAVWRIEMPDDTTSLEQKAVVTSIGLLLNRLPFDLNQSSPVAKVMVVRAAIKHAIPRSTTWVNNAYFQLGYAPLNIALFYISVNYLDPTTGIGETFIVRRREIEAQRLQLPDTYGSYAFLNAYGRFWPTDLPCEKPPHPSDEKNYPFYQERFNIARFLRHVSCRVNGRVATKSQLECLVADVCLRLMQDSVVRQRGSLSKIVSVGRFLGAQPLPYLIMRPLGWKKFDKGHSARPIGGKAVPPLFLQTNDFNVALPVIRRINDVYRQTNGDFLSAWLEGASTADMLQTMMRCIGWDPSACVCDLANGHNSEYNCAECREPVACKDRLMSATHTLVCGRCNSLLNRGFRNRTQLAYARRIEAFLRSNLKRDCTKFRYHESRRYEGDVFKNGLTFLYSQVYWQPLMVWDAYCQRWRSARPVGWDHIFGMGIEAVLPVDYEDEDSSAIPWQHGPRNMVFTLTRLNWLVGQWAPALLQQLRDFVLHSRVLLVRPNDTQYSMMTDPQDMGLRMPVDGSLPICTPSAQSDESAPGILANTACLTSNWNSLTASERANAYYEDPRLEALAEALLPSMYIHAVIKTKLLGVHAMSKSERQMYRQEALTCKLHHSTPKHVMRENRTKAAEFDDSGDLTDPSVQRRLLRVLAQMERKYRRKIRCWNKDVPWFGLRCTMPPNLSWSMYDQELKADLKVMTDECNAYWKSEYIN